MLRKILYAVLALTILLLALAYFNRDSLIDASIRGKLRQKPDPTFLANDGHIRVLLCGGQRRKGAGLHPRVRGRTHVPV